MTTLTTAQVAEVVGVTVKCIERLIKAGIIPAQRDGVGRRRPWQIPASAVKTARTWKVQHDAAPPSGPQDPVRLVAPASGGLEWQESALCAQVDGDAFFPEKGGSTREAKRVCLTCEVRVECLEYALANDERHGVWGGLSERERRRITSRGTGADEVAA